MEDDFFVQPKKIRKLDENNIQKIVEEAPEVEELDEHGLRKLIIQLEKKINQNQLLRAKFPDKPEKFMESEIDLDEEIKKLHSLAAKPELFPLFVELNFIPQLLGLLAHENIDILFFFLSKSYLPFTFFS